MADESASVLKRKALKGRSSGPEGRRPGPGKALSSALVRAADETISLVAAVRGCTVNGWTLAELLEAVPDGGLLAVLEGPGESQGLMAFDPTLLVSVIERQMTGRLAADPPAPRRPTRTDAALSADLIDATLRAFEAEFRGRPEWAWCSGFGYSGYLDDPRPLGLLLEEIDYRVFSLNVELDNGQRSGTALLALPAEGRSPVEADPDQPGAPVTHANPAAWSAALGAALEEGSVPVEAVLWRLRMPIADVSALEVGQLLEIPLSALDQTALVAVDGNAFVSGRLGQCQGKRAVRLAPDTRPGRTQPLQGAEAAPPEAPAPMPVERLVPAQSAPMDADMPDMSDLSDLPDLDFDLHADTLPALT